ncbi:afadin- and alpha-actinin-binding protein B isoform X2 [Triplophysa rosa]|uniref:afadin- and alpha-actinin-binding protein B isoform X2 n=1 Tax=Triplophysa rosa TaxID=992332 RepID=UPI00254614CF|nr:afadin- and alpha-actinin-binding protein B isoform X2 [Triplophysa rosa]
MAHRQITRSRMKPQDNSAWLNSLIMPLHPDETAQSFSHRIFKEQNDHTTSLQEQLTEKDLHISRLQDALTSEREKCATFQSRCNQQMMELKRREQHINRMREKLSQLTDRQKHRSASMEVLNVLPKVPGRGRAAFKAAKADGRAEDALRLLLDRREAELREAMRLRHGLTTLLHMLRKDMAQTLQDDNITEAEDAFHDNVLLQSEQGLGDHVTGGVVQEWTRVQKRLWTMSLQDPVAKGTDQEKLLGQLEAELEQSGQLIQDSVTPPLPVALMDCYYLEEWERLQDRWEELKRQRRSFRRERKAFTDAAIRLGHERCEFERQKASLLKTDFLSISPVQRHSQWNRRESTALGELRVVVPDQLCLSPCAPSTPSSEGSEVTVWSRQNRAKTPNTPELYSALKLPYFRSERSPQFDSWGDENERDVTPDKLNMDWPF